MTGLAPDLHDHGTERIAGQRIRRRLQCGFGIAGAHADHETRIKPEFAPAAHRQPAVLARGEILPDPHHRTARGEPPHQGRDEAGCSRGLRPLRERLMHRPAQEPALQHGVGLHMAERHAMQGRACATIEASAFKAVDILTQPRKRADARALHAPLPFH